MTIPIEDGTAAGVLDIRHHYFEFIPEDQGDRPEPETRRGSTELIEGRNYFIVLTTAGGLYRYKISDLVRCVGFHGRAPLIEFLNKGAHFSSLTGEKLSEFQVVAAVEEAQRLCTSSGQLLPPRPGLGRPPVLRPAHRGRRPVRRTIPGNPGGRGRTRVKTPERRVCLKARQPPPRPSPHTPDSQRLLGRISAPPAGPERRHCRTV